MNALTTMVNNTASGAVTEAWNIMSGDLGAIVYFFIGLTLISVVIAVIYRFTGGRK